VAQHRLKREVIATVLANAMINRGGPAYVSELAGATSATPGEIALAYAATRDVYGLPALNAAIDGLDGMVPGAVQLQLYGAVMDLLRQESLWFLRNSEVTRGLAGLVERHAAGVGALRGMLGSALPASLGDALESQTQLLVGQGVPEPVARSVAELGVLSYASDIVLVSERAGVPVGEGATVFFGVLAAFDLWPVIEQGRALVLSDRFERMALDRALANLMRAQRDLTADVLNGETGAVVQRLANWSDRQATGIERTRLAVSELTRGTLTVSRLSVAAGLLADLAQES